jgi:hypothetical protein
VFANCQLGGQDQASVDVCNEPSESGVTPITFTNSASGAAGSPAVYTVLISGGPAHNLSTSVSTTSGDEAGTAGGLSSGTCMGPSMHTLGSNTFLVGGMPATRMTSTTQQNSTNSTGSRLSPSQLKLLVLAP